MAGWLASAQQSSAAADEAAANLGPLNGDPEFLDNAMTATGEGFMKGGALAAQTLMLAGSVVPRVADLLTAGDNFSGKSLTHRYFEAFDETITDAVDYWTPDARTTGTAGRVLSGIAEFGIPMMLSGGNPLAMASLTSAQSTTAAGADLARSGASAGEAGGVAAVQGAANLIGFGIATRGATALTRAASGAGANLAVNLPADAVSAAILDDTKLADRYDPLNAEARAVDLVVGALFGAMAKGDVVPTRQLDAALTVNQVKHAQTDLAPGILETPQQAKAHIGALRDTERKILEGRDLTGTEGEGVTFKPDPVRIEQERQMALALDDELAALRADAGLDDGPAYFVQEVVTEGDLSNGGVVFRKGTTADAADDAVMARADEAFAQNPDMPIALMDNPDDPASVRVVTAADALDEIKAEAAKNEELGRGYVAAVNCFLRGM